MAQLTSKQKNTNAPTLTVPDEQVISVEHPCIIKNVEKAIDMIGGPPAIAQVIEEASEKTFALSFRPQDPTSKTVIANRKPANNVLLRISVPKRTGRKRKRGSNEAWTEDLTLSSPKKDASYLVNSMADNADLYKVIALSAIPSMHMWRRMPDFVYSTSHIDIVQDAKNKLLSQHYPTVKEFELPRTYGIEDTTTLPPPVWSNVQIPQNYTYRQNPSVKLTQDPVSGKNVLGNTQAPPKTYTYQSAWDDVDYPSTMMPGITPLEKQTPINKETVAALEKLFEKRPIWSRRALLNCLPSKLSAFNVVRFCLGYVSYAIRSGPWRDTLVKLGIDPRKDPKYRVYQTIMLQLVPKANQLALASGVTPRKTNSYKPKAKANAEAAEETPNVPLPVQTEKERLLESRRIFQRKWTGSDNATSHIFDGLSPLPPDGKVWQLCDFTDPQLAALRDIPEVHIRAVCESRYFGWYENGTNAKIRVALKAKVEALAEGHLLDPDQLRGFMLLPEKLAFEIDSDAATNAAVAYPHPSDNSSEIQASAVITMQTPTKGSGSGSNSLSAYLGDKPTQQQLSWAAAYRAFAKTGLGSVPASGASGKGRLTKSKPLARKSYLGGSGGEAASAQGFTNASNRQQDIGSNTNGTTLDQPIDVDVQMEDADTGNGAQLSEDAGVEEGEDVLPSIEVDGFDVDEDGDSELGLDDDELEIKVEEGDEQGNDQFQVTAKDGPAFPRVNVGNDSIVRNENQD